MTIINVLTAAIKHVYIKYRWGAPYWMCLSLDIRFNIGWHMLPSDSFMPCLDSLLRYCTGEFQDLPLIVFVVFGPVD